MKESGLIKVEKREHGSKGTNKRLRKEGYLPGNIFGKGIGSIPISIKKEDLVQNISKFGRNAVFKLELSSEENYPVMIREVQYLRFNGGDIHVDFQKITLTEDTKIDVTIKVIGKETLDAHNLMALNQMDTIPVKGLPQNMPEAIEIDVSDMQAGDSITINDIKLPEGIVCEIPPEQIVVIVKISQLYEPVEESKDAIAED